MYYVQAIEQDNLTHPKSSLKDTRTRKSN